VQLLVEHCSLHAVCSAWCMHHGGRAASPGAWDHAQPMQLRQARAGCSRCSCSAAARPKRWPQADRSSRRPRLDPAHAGRADAPRSQVLRGGRAPRPRAQEPAGPAVRPARHRGGPAPRRHPQARPAPARAAGAYATAPQTTFLMIAAQSRMLCQRLILGSITVVPCMVPQRPQRSMRAPLVPAGPAACGRSHASR